MSAAGVIRADAEVNKVIKNISAIIKDAATELAAKRPLEPSDLVKRMRVLYGNGEGIDWSQMGRDASVYFREAPSIGNTYHMSGVFDNIEIKVRKALQQRKNIREEDDDQVPMTQPVILTEMEKAEAVGAARSQALYTELLKLRHSHGEHVRCKDGENRKQLLHFIRTIFDPWSFSQTVENIFYLSFLVKQGFIGLYYGEPVTSSSSSSSTTTTTITSAQFSTVPYIAVYDQDQLKEILHNEMSRVQNEHHAVQTTLTDSLGGSTTAGRSRRTAAIAASSAITANITGQTLSGAISRASQLAIHIDQEAYAKINHGLQLKRPLVSHRKMHDCTCPNGTEHTDDTRSVQQAIHASEVTHAKQNQPSAHKKSRRSRKDDDEDDEDVNNIEDISDD